MNMPRRPEKKSAQIDYNMVKPGNKYDWEAIEPRSELMTDAHRTLLMPSFVMVGDSSRVYDKGTDELHGRTKALDNKQYYAAPQIRRTPSARRSRHTCRAP